ncbi:helix-turn-helix domain-containing protein [Pseudomonas aeruginosa]|uniref:helix-turn-helix domain-containing protein n=1 Tax=Pseudomonas aeruginosa TaxID=287 RepID=UPI0021B2AF86|nr:helix-turn-helix transcriptional regulator [Pseudomonas aeruginosa]MCT7418384.1 helix-turn-helix domain-containing protein [Pseudomonas aeruginosa]
MSDVTMAIGENIRKARERKGLRQEQVAEMAGIPLSTYKNYEHGKQPLTRRPDRAIARTLGVSADELVFEESERQVADELRALFKRFEVLPPDLKNPSQSGTGAC